jgi:hypothetical protein
MYPYEAETMGELRTSAMAVLANTATQTNRRSPCTSAHLYNVERFQALRQERRVSLVAQGYGGPQCKVPLTCEDVEAFLVELASYYLYCQVITDQPAYTCCATCQVD